MSASAVPSEFDLELESERSRWLRRRFIILCLVGTALTLLMDGRHMVTAMRGSGADFASARVNSIGALANIGLYLLSAAWVWRRPRQAKTLLRRTIWLVVMVGTVDLISARIAIGLELAGK